MASGQLVNTVFNLLLVLRAHSNLAAVTFKGKARKVETGGFTHSALLLVDSQLQLMGQIVFDRSDDSVSVRSITAPYVRLKTPSERPRSHIRSRERLLVPYFECVRAGVVQKPLNHRGTPGGGRSGGWCHWLGWSRFDDAAVAVANGGPGSVEGVSRVRIFGSQFFVDVDAPAWGFAGPEHSVY